MCNKGRNDHSKGHSARLKHIKQSLKNYQAKR